MNIADINTRPPFDNELVAIADYIQSYQITSNEAWQTARYCLMDTLGCGLLALRYPECTKLIGPLVDNAVLPNGARVPGTRYQLDPVQSAFNIGTLIRWLDYNDTWLAAEWGHPSDNLGAILALADYISRQSLARMEKPLTMKTVLQAMIKAHEIQGVLALENAFNRVGLDHVVLVKVASTAVACQLLGCNKEQLLNALSLAWVDGQSLRTYRHAPNTGTRKSWAAGDATSRGVRLALMAKKGEMGYPAALSAKQWGFYDAVFKGQKFQLQRPYHSYVMENILFKISFPAEFHAQTAVEAAIKLHPHVRDRLENIEKIQIETQEAAIRIISKTGALYNPADRDHCLQYMAAVGLIFGNLTADHYEDATAKDPRIDSLRTKMQVSENLQFSRDYLDPEKRSISNSIQVFFKDGASTDKITIEYPVGHRRRRAEGIPLLIEKFNNNLLTRFPKAQAEKIYEVCQNQELLENMNVPDFMDMFVI